MESGECPGDHLMTSELRSVNSYPVTYFKVIIVKSEFGQNTSGYIFNIVISYNWLRYSLFLFLFFCSLKWGGGYFGYIICQA